MRTKIDTLSKTCPECGTRNRLHIFTTGYSPSWRIACSNCIAIIIEPRTRHGGWSLARVSDPIADVVVLSEKTSKRRARVRGGVPSLPFPHRIQNLLPRRHAAAGMLTACALVLAAFVGAPALKGGDPAEIGAKNDTDGSGGELLAAATGTRDGKDTGQAGTPGQAEAMPENGVPAIVNAPLPEMILRASLDGAPRIPHAHSSGAQLPHDLNDTASPHPASLAGDDLRDPRESMATLQDSVFRDPVAAALSETALDLSPAERRSLQRRLHLASHDTKGIDGIFGRATRAAIAEWQSQAGLAPTGFATRPTVTRLIAETEAAYDAWRQAEIERRESEQRLALIVPVPRPDVASGTSTCSRTITGEIAYGQSFACDVRGLGENLKSIKQNFAQAFASSEPTRLRSRGPGDA